MALIGALNGNRQALRDAKPTTMIEVLARNLALGALDGRAPAQKLVLEILDGADCGAPACTRTWARPRREGHRKHLTSAAEEETKKTTKKSGGATVQTSLVQGKKQGKFKKRTSYITKIGRRMGALCEPRPTSSNSLLQGISQGI